MFSIIQAHKTQILLQHLGHAYSHAYGKGQSIFDEFIVLVPSMVLGDWLQKEIATQYGISTLITTTFWGQYQWQLMQIVLNEYNQQLQEQGRASEIVRVPEVAVLSSTVMQWRIFAYLVHQQEQILADNKHPLNEFLENILINESEKNKKEQEQTEKNQFYNNEHQLWQVASEFAKVYNRYLTHRSEWLDLWENGKTLDVEAIIAEKDELNQLFNNTSSVQITPDWLIEHYILIEKTQSYLWQALFAGAYQHRKQIENNFWQAIKDKNLRKKINLPTDLYLFTVQQLPLSELAFLQKLSQFIDIHLLHYNPSQMFWADIVDKRWLAHQQLINPSSVYLRDYGHSLLSRLGKQSRETFASLASLSGNENSKNFQLDWHDDFQLDDDFHQAIIEEKPLPLLQRLQYDVLMLEESDTTEQLNQQLIKTLQENLLEQVEEQLKEKKLPNNRQWQLNKNSLESDDSLQIHSCHSLQRQLEILRNHLAFWLNSTPKGERKRQLADILVLLPDVENNYDLIHSVFVEGRGQDGLTLPARITGVVDKEIRQLWQAICGYYRLLGAKFARFEAEEVLEWLALPCLYQSLGLTHEQVARGCQLLLDAGFVRGFDEEHLQQSLAYQDTDYRFSFAYALDKLVLGLLMPQAEITNCLYPPQENWQADKLVEQTIPHSVVTLNDAPIIHALCEIYQSLNRYRHEYQQAKSPSQWIVDIEKQIIHPLFSEYSQTKEMRAIFKAMNGFRRSLRANNQPNSYYPNHTDEEIKNAQLNLRLEFVLESIEAELESQQISAEPTGVITFGRFGSLRTVPYPLVVMLNMNLSEFPRQDKDERYDLMKAGLARRGDRSSEDDDNGAFLDALLCATNSCWIFYNGRSLTDNHEHLPANPVSELLQFLQGEIDWQIDNSLSAEAQATQQYLPKLIKNWLVTEHAPLPFSPQIFTYPLENSAEQSTQQLLTSSMESSKRKRQAEIPPNPLWQQVYHKLTEQAEQAETKKTSVQLLTKKEYQQIAQWLVNETAELPTTQGELTEFAIHQDIGYLARQIAQPARTYLTQQQVRITEEQDNIQRQEPLSLDSLSRYQLNKTLLDNLANNEKNTVENLLFNTLIPAGVARQTTLENEQEKLNKNLAEFTQILQQQNIFTEKQIITPCHEVTHIMPIKLFGLEQDIQLKGQIPTRATPYWISLLPNTASPKHLLNLWLSHLYWQIVRNTDDKLVDMGDGTSICYFHKAFSKNTKIEKFREKQIFSLAPITAEQAKIELIKWLKFAYICQHYPIVLMPDFAMNYLALAEKAQAKGNSKYYPSIKDFDDWLGNSFNQTKIYDNNSKHNAWQYILGTNRDNPDSRQAFSALKTALLTLAEPLFMNFYQGTKNCSLKNH